MSTSVASGNPLKTHTNRQRESPSESPDIDDQNSSIDFEDELEQELEKELSATYDNLFGDEDDEDDDDDDLFEEPSVAAEGTNNNHDTLPSGSKTRTKLVVSESDDDDKEDEDADTDLFGGFTDSDDDQFEDPPTPATIATSASPSNQPPSTTAISNGVLDKDDEEDSASDDEFEAVDVNAVDGHRINGLSPTSAPVVPDLDTKGREPSPKKQKLSYKDSGHVSSRRKLGDIDFLERHKDDTPSMILHLFDSHFRFEGQEGVFLYNGPMRFFFDALNEGKIPVDLVDVLGQLNCLYYEGCLIVQVQDHRCPVQEPKAKRQRVSELLTWSSLDQKSHNESHNANGMLSNTDGSGVKIYKKIMRPTSESFHLDLQLVCERERSKLSKEDILEMEGKVLLATEEPLDLEPDFQLSRVSNATRYIEYAHMIPHNKRKYNSAEIEAEQAEHEEKQKLLTLMDERKSHGDFQPTFNRVSMVGDWRHRRYINDAAVYPAAVPPTAMQSSFGRKSAVKKNKSQMSLLEDGRKVIRTLRFVQTINGKSTHTVFHVVELPSGNGLQGILRWGTLPDTSINGGTESFSFPTVEIMRTHIDNLKLLQSIENSRLIYDSAYPNGVPTSGPPPSVTSTPVISSRTALLNNNLNAVVSTSPTVSNASPVVPQAALSVDTGSPAVSTKSVAKGAGRGSRKNSPQPRKKKTNATASRESVEPDGGKATTATTKKGKGAKARGKKSSKESTPASVDDGTTKKSNARTKSYSRATSELLTASSKDGDGDEQEAEDGDDLPLAQGTSGSLSAVNGGGSLPMSPAMANASVPLMQNPQLAADIISQLPKHITPEFLKENPVHADILRKMFAQAKLNRQQQQQHGSGAPGGVNMMSNAQMVLNMQQNGNPVGSPANAAGLGSSPGMQSAPMPAPLPAVAATATATAATPSQTQTQTLQQLLQNLLSREELAVFRVYCQLKNIRFQGIEDPRFSELLKKAKNGELRNMLQAVIGNLPHQQGPQLQQEQQFPQARIGHTNVPVQNTLTPANPAVATSGTAAASAAANNTMARPPMPPSLHLANMNPHGQQRFVEPAFQNRQQEMQLNGMARSSSTTTPMAQTIQIANMSVAGGSMQSRPPNHMMGSPTPAPAFVNPAAGNQQQQQQLFIQQQLVLANMPQQQKEAFAKLPQQRKLEFLQQLQQQQQQQRLLQQQQAANVNGGGGNNTGAAPRLLQGYISMVLQQLNTGQLNPSTLQPNVIFLLLKHAEANMTLVQRQNLQRILEPRIQQLQNSTQQQQHVRPQGSGSAVQ